MIKVLSAKTFTGNPADGIDNVNLAVFSRVNPAEFVFWSEAPDDFKERGVVRKIKLVRRNKWLRLFEKILLMRKMGPEIIWGNGGVADILFLFFKPRATKYIIDWHTALLRGDGWWRVRTPWFLRKFIFNKADLVIAVSEFSAASVLKYFPKKKVSAILNGIDLDFFNPKRENPAYLTGKYQLDFSRPLVAYVGTLQPRKRPEIFLAVAERCRRANFVMVGRQSTAGSFDAKISQARNLKWIESMSREDVARLLASSSVFLFPSVNEPAAAVILEAMASGCVPIASKSGGNGEFFEDGKSGFLVDVGPGEEKEFIAKLDLLLKDVPTQQKMSLAARAEAEKHSWDKVAKEYENTLLQS